MVKYNSGRFATSRFSSGRFSSIGAVSGLPFFDPEAGLAMDSSVPPGTLIDAALVSRDAPVVLAADFVGLDGSGGGLIAEFGGSWVGAYCGFRTSGAFIVRCGEANQSGPPFSDNCAYVFAAVGVVDGDGTLVVEFVPGTPIKARAWWNGVELDGAVNGSSGEPTWAGSDEGGYLINGANIAVGEVGTVVNYSQASPLRHYRNQVVT